MPSLAHCVDFSTNNRPPSKSLSNAIHLPTIHKRMVLQQTTHPYAARRIPATDGHKTSQKQQKATHTLPHVANTIKLTGTKL